MKIALISLEDRAIEWFAALVMLWWAFNLSLAGDMLASDRFSGFHQFSLSEPVWAGIFGSLALTRLVALYINGRRPKTPYIRATCAGMGFLIYAWIALALASPAVPAMQGGRSWQEAQSALGPAWGIYQLLAFFEIFSVYRAMKDSRYQPVGHRGTRNVA